MFVRKQRNRPRITLSRAELINLHVELGPSYKIQYTVLYIACTSTSAVRHNAHDPRITTVVLPCTPDFLARLYAWAVMRTRARASSSDLHKSNIPCIVSQVCNGRNWRGIDSTVKAHDQWLCAITIMFMFDSANGHGFCV